MRRFFGWFLTIALALAMPAWSWAGPGEPTARAQGLSAEVAALYRQGKLADALAKAEQAVAQAERAHGPSHVQVGMALYDLAVVHSGLGRHREHEAALVRARKIFEQHPNAPRPAILAGTGAPEGTALNHTLVALAHARAALGDTAGTKEALYAILERHQGPDAEASGLDYVLAWLLQLEQVLQSYDRAWRICQRLVALREKVEGPRSRPVAAVLNACGTIEHQAGRWSEAAATFERALGIVEAAPEPQDAIRASITANLAALLHLLGRHRQAEERFAEALALQEQILGPESPALSALVTNLATFHRDRGDFVRAEQLALRGVRLAEADEDPAQVVIALMQLADVRLLLERYDEAAGDLKRARELAEPFRVQRARTYGQVLLRLVELRRRQERYPEAVALADEAVEVIEGGLGADHPYVADALSQVGALYYSRQDVERAQAAQERALAIRRRVLGSDHPEIVINLTNLAMVAKRAGKLDQALELYREATELRERILRELLSLGTEQQKLAYLGDLAWETRQVIRAHLPAAVDDRRAARLALLTLLRRKGRVLDVMRDDLSLLRRKLEGDDAAMLEKLARTRRQLASTVLSGAGPAAASQVEALRREGSELERELSRRSAPFRATLTPVTIQAVQAALPGEGVLVEYVTYLPSPDDVHHPRDRYAAYVLPKKGAVRAVDLGSAEAIDEAVKRLRRVLADPRALADVAARELDALVMEPIRPLLGGATRIFVSPEGQLQLVPFGALRGPDGAPLVTDYTFTTLTSGRDLLRPATPSPGGQRVLLVGAPAFGPRQPAQSAASEPRAAKGRRLVFPPLPGTEAELRSLAELVPAAELLTGRAATESQVKAIRRPRVLHLATHGFFLPTESSRGQAAATGLRSSSSSTASVAAAGPLLRSGLALAGANTRQPSEGGEDGILTALEASTLDLSGTQLVVLSACETGLGEIRTGQGVHGLRRALVMAGAETQVMSLWRVDDDATRTLMEAYYRQLLAGRDRVEAMRQVQLQMLAEPRTRHPFYWAAFIVSGGAGPVFEPPTEPWPPA
ncbi:MAG: CHAT domain-containing protein, partial [Deltaproteobacteria bacterium]|nr:CHAT domain-containing protein [Deltaproteobacteria bacterium]MBW2535867.1 CHAT domain-containing protein [Deltaproteobacteria bacterium]